MSAIDRFLLLARAYRDATGLKTTALSWRLFGDSKKLGAIENGADIQVTRYERALQWFSDNWPEDAVWPAVVPRPTAVAAAPAAIASTHRPEALAS